MTPPHLTSPHRSPISPSSTDTAHFPRMSFINGCGLINRNHAHISTYPLHPPPGIPSNLLSSGWSGKISITLQVSSDVDYCALPCITLQVSKLITWSSLVFLTDDLRVKFRILISILPSQNISASSTSSLLQDPSVNRREQINKLNVFHSISPQDTPAAPESTLQFVPVVVTDEWERRSQLTTHNARLTSVFCLT